MSNKTLSGSCLCGKVRYTATGQEQRFYHCHCMRCRKASGTGHASNLFVQGTLAWESGEELVTSFKVPDAKHFTNTFCRECGGRLPRFIEAVDMVFIPAGSLDDVPEMGPQARIFTDSGAAWACDDSELPEFSKYPPP